MEVLEAAVGDRRTSDQADRRIPTKKQLKSIIIINLNSISNSSSRNNNKPRSRATITLIQKRREEALTKMTMKIIITEIVRFDGRTV